MDKPALRRALRARRAEARAADPGGPDRLLGHALAGYVWTKVRTVAGYWPLGDEMDVRPLLVALAAGGIRVCLPRTPPSRDPGPLSFRVWDPRTGAAALEASAFGVMEPASGAAAALPDVVLAPLLGFDRRGGRLGWGQGHYDRTLAHWAAHGHRPVLCGIGWAAQEVAAVPMEPHDVPLDWVFTEEGAYRLPS